LLAGYLNGCRADCVTRSFSKRIVPVINKNMDHNNSSCGMARIAAATFVTRTPLRRTRRHASAAAALLATAAACLVHCASSGETSNDKMAGYHQVQTFCKRSYIEVSGLWLTCDTPGAYYYGSTAYRNSEVCMSGDKANLVVDCTCKFSWTVDLVWTLSHLSQVTNCLFFFIVLFSFVSVLLPAQMAL
jgi:hypothetical protein